MFLNVFLYYAELIQKNIIVRTLIWLKWLIFSLKQATIKSNCLNKILVSKLSLTVLYDMIKYRCGRILRKSFYPKG